MSKIVKPTELRRILLTTTAERVLGPLEGDLDIVRYVQPIIPPGKSVFLWLDKTPTEIGPSGRNYKVPPFPPNASAPFPLLGHQWIVGAAAQGVVTICLLISYHQP